MHLLNGVTGDVIVIVIENWLSEQISNSGWSGCISFLANEHEFGINLVDLV